MNREFGGCENCGAVLPEVGTKYSCPCCDSPLCRKCHRTLKDTLAHGRKL